MLTPEGLSGMVREVEGKNLLERAYVGGGGENLKVSLLQYVDDTIFFQRNSMKDIVALKTILRCFELVSRLKVNFFKSSSGGINVDGMKIQQHARVLNCTII